MDLTREQVVAHRIAAHGLVDRAADPTGLAVLDLGVQNTPPGSAQLAVSVRLAEPLPPDADPTAGGELAIVWSHRGSPHLHRAAGLRTLAAQCWPRSDDDAAIRLGWQRTRIAEVGGAVRDGYRTVALAVAAVLAEHPDGITKADLSTRVTARIPAELSPFCKPCGVHHVGESLLRVSGLAGGLQLRAGATRPLVLDRIPDWPGPPADDEAGNAAVQAAYVALHGPATPADTAGFIGTTRAEVAPGFPDDLVPVRVDGQEAAVHPADVGVLGDADPGALAGLVRLLPPSDPLLQARDRETLVPDAGRRKAIWTAIGAPGALLCGTGVAGVWRTSQKGRALTVTATAFRQLTAAERAGLDAEAERLRTTRGARTVAVAISRN